jgi:hypothetical protein
MGAWAVRIRTGEALRGESPRLAAAAHIRRPAGVERVCRLRSTQMTSASRPVPEAVEGVALRALAAAGAIERRTSFPAGTMQRRHLALIAHPPPARLRAQRPRPSTRGAT